LRVRSDREAHTVPIKNYLPNFPGRDPADLSDSPKLGPVKRWLYGVLLPAVPVAYGIWAAVRQRVAVPGRTRSTVLAGAPAVAFAVAWVAAGAFAHFHFFWGPHPMLWRLADLGKIVAALVFIGALVTAGYLLIQG
jgi:hypothetical protein